jgi:hypothetical protein
LRGTDFSTREDPVPPRHLLSLFLLVLLVLPSSLFAQSQRMPRDPTAPIGDADDARDRMTRDMAKKANEERHVALKNDTDKLLKLAVELKAYVDKSNSNVLSVDVVKKAEEIEKLAHSVKDKMKGPN